LLDGSVYVSPEYVVKGGGHVDFQIEDRRWALELIRRGNRFASVKHCDRFLHGGDYYDMVQSGRMEKFIVLNFTTMRPEKTGPGSFLVPLHENI
jgi:hypothetical protein